MHLQSLIYKNTNKNCCPTKPELESYNWSEQDNELEIEENYL